MATEATEPVLMVMPVMRSCDQPASQRCAISEYQAQQAVAAMMRTSPPGRAKGASAPVESEVAIAPPVTARARAGRRLRARGSPRPVQATRGVDACTHAAG